MTLYKRSKATASGLDSGVISRGDAQDWVVCPACGSDDATLTSWVGDRDASFECPDCDIAQYEVNWATDPTYGGDD